MVFRRDVRFGIMSGVRLSGVFSIEAQRCVKSSPDDDIDVSPDAADVPRSILCQPYIPEQQVIICFQVTLVLTPPSKSLLGHIVCCPRTHRTLIFPLAPYSWHCARSLSRGSLSASENMICDKSFVMEPYLDGACPKAHAMQDVRDSSMHLH